MLFNRASIRPVFRINGLGLAFTLAATVAATNALAQSRHNIEGTPLDTLRNSHLTADVPDAKDFVKETRPDSQALGYTPLIGDDPERPKPRNAAGVKALQAELENAAAKNTARARGLVKGKKAALRKPAGG